MRVREIKDSIFYCGVNDRVTDRFENLWPLPYGVSYNSYIVKGEEKIALIDSVEISSLYEFLKSIKLIIGNSPIDYLVVNHMEPDHSGCIPALLKEYPELKIVGNRQTIPMLKGYYGVDDSCLLEIKDNEVIDLGKKTLRFITTPLVHWPETMMTYVSENKLLFTGDAFGCFGALNGGVVDSEMNTEWYTDEIYRYYSNIVGKYGKPVQNAIQKIRNLNIELEYICPTHGPVWHDRLQEVVKIYNDLSQYKSEDGVTIIYGSMYGNTREVAEAIADRLNEKGVKTIKMHDASKSNLSYMISDAFRYKGLIVGSPTYSMHMFPRVEDFMVAIETRELKNKAFAIFGSHTWASAALSKLQLAATDMKLEPVASLDMKYAPGADIIEEAYNLADKVYEALK